MPQWDSVAIQGLGRPRLGSGEHWFPQPATGCSGRLAESVPVLHHSRARLGVGSAKLEIAVRLGLKLGVGLGGVF